MPLPALIEIVPLPAPVQAAITVPGSKSITNRALILAALSQSEVTLQGALWSEDTQVMVDCLKRLGFAIDVLPDEDDACNRTIKVKGLGGNIPAAGTAQKPLELFVGNAGTAARFLAAFVCLGHGVYRLSGVPRMHERPQAALFEALRQLGYQIDSADDKLPARIHGDGPHPGLCWVSIAESSQFASALFLSAEAGGWDIQVAGENEEESPYVALTTKVVKAFPSQGGVFQIEPDASSGSYFCAAGCQEVEELIEQTSAFGEVHQSWSLSMPSVQVLHWPESGWQVDARFKDVFTRIQFGSTYFQSESSRLPPEHRGKWQKYVQDLLERIHESASSHAFPDRAEHPVPDWALGGRTISRRTDLGDSIMTAIALAPLSILPLRFTELGRLRLQECERVMALRTELTRCGAKVIEENDTLVVYPSAMHGAEIETYNDHRMAMCFAILGLKIPGIKIKNPACVKKTFPNFFQKLAAAAPRGLATVIRDASSGRALGGEELFAG